jgi:hypothetical protein
MQAIAWLLVFAFFVGVFQRCKSSKRDVHVDLTDKDKD